MAGAVQLDTNYTFFGDPKRQFPEIHDDNNIDIAQFLAASEIMPSFFANMGKQFVFVKNDIQQNVHKIKAAHEAYPECKTIKEILEFEISKKVHKKDNSCTVALLWFRRGLLFMYLLLRQLLVAYRKNGDKIPDTSFSTSAAKIAYKLSLKRYHNVVVGGLVTKVAIPFLPNPHNMVLDLAFGDESKIPQVALDTEAMLDLLKPCLMAIVGYYKEKGELAPQVADEGPEQCDAWQSEVAK